MYSNNELMDMILVTYALQSSRLWQMSRMGHFDVFHSHTSATRLPVELAGGAEAIEPVPAVLDM